MVDRRRLDPVDGLGKGRANGAADMSKYGDWYINADRVEDQVPGNCGIHKKRA